MTEPLVFQRAGRSHQTGGPRLSLWHVGTASSSRILVAKCSGMALLHTIAREGVLLDVRTAAPATDATLCDPVDLGAAKAFRESVRRALDEIEHVAPELAAELRRCFRIYHNAAFLQRDALSPDMRLTRETHADMRDGGSVPTLEEQ